MDAYNATNWTGLFGAELSASAALTGLIFVAVSINLERILACASLPGRVLKALLLVVDVLVISTFVLVPGQSIGLLGVELVGLGVLGLFSIVRLDLRAWRLTETPYRRGLARLMVFGVGSTR